MAGPAQACRVEVVGIPSAAWQEAATSLPPAPSAGADCAALRIDVDDQGADLTFMTQDGRRAERRLSQPDELSPAVMALRVAAPPPGLLAEGSSTTPAGAPATVSAAEAAAPAPPALRAAPREPAQGLLFSLLAGARAGDRALLSPVLMGALQLQLRRWELGASLAWEARYYRLEVPRPHGPRTLLAPALGFARRQPLGRSALLAGARLGFGISFPAYQATIDYAAELDPPLAAQRSYEGRLGLLVGVAVPREASVRFRAELAAEFVFWRSHYVYRPNTEPSAISYSAYATPFWALSALVGVEFGGS